MKKVLLSLLFILPFLTAFAQEPAPGSQEWENIQKEAVERILEEKLHWPENFDAPGSHELMQKWNSAGPGETKVSSSTDASVSEAEPFIAINPTDSNNLVLSYMENGGGGLAFPIYYTTDGGNSWQPSGFDPQAVTTSDFQGLIIGGGGDPVFAYDNSGKLYYSWLYLLFDFLTLEGRMAMYWSYSTDGGQTFTVVQDSNRFIGLGSLTLQGGIGNYGDGVVDRQWMAVDRSGGQYDGTLYTSMLFLPSANSGLNGSGMVVRTKQPQFDSLNYVNAVVDPSQEVQFGNVAVDGLGNLHITYGDLNNNLIKHAVSTDGGTTFSNPTTVAAASGLMAAQGGPYAVHDRENAASNLYADPNGDNLYVVWTDLVGSEAKGYFSYSWNGGTTWSIPLDLASLDPNGTVTQAFMPSVAVDQNGNLSVSFHGLDADDVGDFYVAESKDSGQTFEDARPMTAAPTDFASYSGGGSFFGDYETSVKYGCRTYSVWADGRNATGPKMYVGITDHCLPFVGISDLTPVSSLLDVGPAYPNPGVNEVKFEVESKASAVFNCSLLSVEGKVVRNLGEHQVPAGNSTLRLPVSGNLARGWYLVSLETPEGRVIRKWLVD